LEQSQDKDEESMTPDLIHAVKGRRRNLNKIWSSKEWAEKKAAFLEKNPYCAMHISASRQRSNNEG